MVLSAPLAAPRSWVPRLPEHIVARPRLDDLLNVPVDDEGCLVDVDTPDEYRKLIP